MLFGVAAGVVLTAALVLLPAVMTGDFYEITDPLVFMGTPIVMVCGAIGALVGAVTSPALGPDGTVAVRGVTWVQRVGVIGAAAAVTGLAVWLFGQATGVF